MWFDEEKKEEKPVLVHLGSRGSSGYGREYNAEIRGLRAKELESIECAMLGGCWIRVKDGRLERHESYLSMPEPVRDKEIEPFWGYPQQEKLWEIPIDHKKAMKGHFPAILINSLCGYDYTPNRYAATAQILEDIGFVCLRSRRKEDGRYWETWWLPGMYAAKGSFLEAIEKAKDGPAKDGWNETAKLQAALEWLTKHISFGSLEVTVQRMCMVVD